jgi:hypothetical protein
MERCLAEPHQQNSCHFLHDLVSCKFTTHFAGQIFIAQYSWGFTMASVVAVLVFCPLISALAFNAPAATPMADALELLPQVEIPQPTEAPSLELHKRQSNVQYSLLEGPDSICGYQYGQSSKCRILTTILNCPKTDFRGKAASWESVVLHDVDLQQQPGRSGK